MKRYNPEWDASQQISTLLEWPPWVVVVAGFGWVWPWAHRYSREYHRINVESAPVKD